MPEDSDERRATGLEEMAALTVPGNAGAVVLLTLMAFIPGIFGAGPEHGVLLFVPGYLISTAYTLVTGRVGTAQVMIQSVYGSVCITIVGLLAEQPLAVVVCVVSNVLVPLSAVMTQRRRLAYVTIALSAACSFLLVVSTEGGLLWRVVSAVAVAAIGLAPSTTVLDYRARLEEALRETHRLATTDLLTGLANRRGLAERSPLLLARAARTGRLAVLVADLDHFKSINDVHGHAAGDDVLRRVAASIGETTRGSDLTARIGGEEFCVVALLERAEDLDRLAERIRLAVEVVGDEWHVTVSVGGVLAAERAPGSAGPDPEQLIWTLIDRADALMYEAKQAGRNVSRVLAA